MSIRQNGRWAKRPFGKTSVGKMSVRQNVFWQNVFWQNVFRQSVFRQNVRPPINSVNHKNTQNTQALVDIQVDSGQTTRNIVCKIDTGAEGNVIPLDLYTQLHHIPCIIIVATLLIG